MKLMIINGPNLNMIGHKAKDMYGTESFLDVCGYIKDKAEERGHSVTILQTNIEGEIINFLQKAYFENYAGVIVNPGAYIGTSRAIHDAIDDIGIPTVEVNFTNVNAQILSAIAPVCIGQIHGFGKIGYILAIEALEDYIARRKANLE